MKSRWLPTMPLHVANWLADPRIQMLSPANRCHLIEAICRSWMLGESVAVPDEIRSTFDYLWPEYLTVRAEHEAGYERRRKQTEAARAARHASVTDSVSGSVTERSPSPSPSPSPSKKEKPSRPVGWDDFWAIYPAGKRVKKAKALSAYARLVRPSDVPGVLAALRADAASAEWRRENGRYVPHPTSWLNARRWEDEDDSGATPTGPDQYAGQKEHRADCPTCGEPIWGRRGDPETLPHACRVTA